MTTRKILFRKEVPDKDKWDLSPLFKNDQAWLKNYLEIEKKISGYSNFSGTLTKSLKHFKKVLDFDLDISRQIEALYTYAHLKNDEDKSNQLYLGLYEKAISLYTRASELASFITPEIQALPPKIMEKYLKSPELKDYQFYLKKILRFRPHTHDQKTERILSLTTDLSGAASSLFSQLDNVDLKFGFIKNDKKELVELSHANFNTFLINESRAIRKKAFQQYYQVYDDHKNTIASALGSSVKKDYFYAKVRNFSTCREASLFKDNINLKVYDNLLKTVKDNLKPFFKYLKFRKKVLGLKELHFYDTYVPLVKKVNFKMPYKEAVAVCLKALRPLGEEYLAILEKGLLSGWVDRYENRGKRSGAYSSGCYDSPPYILLNYEEDNINSLYTLIHEAGHSMHSYYAKKNQSYLNHNYTIFVAEVASTFNETLLTRYLLTYYQDNPKMAKYILNREIDNIRGTLFRQTMFAEFEKKTHDLVEKNQPLTLEVLLQEYQRLLQIYLGPELYLDQELSLECLRIPHFYSAFYVYKYATGISAAIALAEKVLQKGSNARDKYLNFLTLGGTLFPLDQLKKAGVNMNSTEPIKDTINYFGNLVQTLIKGQ